MRGHVAFDNNQPQRKFYKSNQQIKKGVKMIENLFIVFVYLLGFAACGVIAAGVAWVAKKTGLADWLRCQWWAAPFFLD